LLGLAFYIPSASVSSVLGLHCAIHLYIFIFFWLYLLLYLLVSIMD